MKNITTLALFVTLASATALPALTQASAPQTAPAVSQSTKAAVSAPFKGIEVNGGTVSLFGRNGRQVLKLSADFQIPKSPAPHWQIVDGEGNVFLLQRLTIVGDKSNGEIVLPKYVKSIAKVQIWCSFAEVLLGETSFGSTVKTR